MRLSDFLILLVCIFSSSKVFPQSVNLDSLIDEAMLNNPQLQAAHFEVGAVQTRIKQAGAWEAPQVGIDFYDTPVESFPVPTRKNMETDYFIQQTVPWPGKLSSKVNAAKYGARMTEQNYLALKKKIIRDLKTSYFELYLIQRKIEINKENQNLMGSLIDIAMKQYEVGKGKQSDVIRAQTQLSFLIEDESTLEKEKIIGESAINALLNRPMGSAFSNIPETVPKKSDWPLHELGSLIENSRSELLAVNFNIQMNESALMGYRKESYPDLMVRGTYKRFAGANDSWGFMVGASIPLAWWSKNKYRGQMAEGRLQIDQSKSEYSYMKNLIQLELQSALANLKSNHHHVELFKNTILPQAEQTLSLTLTEYQSGLTEFLMVIDAYRTLLMAKLEYQMHLTDLLKSQADLEQAVGLSINDINEKITVHRHQE